MSASDQSADTASSAAAERRAYEQLKSGLLSRGAPRKHLDSCQSLSELRELGLKSGLLVARPASAAVRLTRKRRRKEAEPASSEHGRPLNGNELLDRWRANRATLPSDFGRLLDPSLGDQRRGDLFEAEDEQAMDQFAWAIPDEKALRACAAFSPIVEMGAGAGYWARLLREMGAVVHPFDCAVGPDTCAAGVLAAPWTSVRRGGPEKLSRFSDCALLLIYPDDLESPDGPDPPRVPLSVASLENYKGDTVIHVGEWLGETVTLSMEGQATGDIQYPWGRSTDPSFQVQLCAQFHKVLQLPLPNWGSVRNSLTVWKRTATVLLGGEDRYGYVPEEERIVVATAAPCMQHLL